MWVSSPIADHTGSKFLASATADGMTKGWKRSSPMFNCRSSFAMSFFIPFLTTLLAELGDKSQIGIILLSTRTHRRELLFFGTVYGFILVDGLAILFGGTVLSLLSPTLVRMGAGALFVILGILSLAEKADHDAHESRTRTNPFLAGFTLIALAEWGDKTQLASAGFAVEFPLLPVFFAVITALALLSALAIVFGHTLTRYVGMRHITIASGIVFIAIGLSMLLH